MATATRIRASLDRGVERRGVYPRGRVDSPTVLFRRTVLSVATSALQHLCNDTHQPFLVNRFYPKTSQNGEYSTRLFRGQRYGPFVCRPNLRRPSRSVSRFGRQDGGCGSSYTMLRICFVITFIVAPWSLVMFEPIFLFSNPSYMARFR